jgi:hypothetical protein
MVLFDAWAETIWAVHSRTSAWAVSSDIRLSPYRGHVYLAQWVLSTDMNRSPRNVVPEDVRICLMTLATGFANSLKAL